MEVIEASHQPPANSPTSPTNSTTNNNNVHTTNNNCTNEEVKQEKGFKLPPVSTISNNSFLWDPDVDGDMVNMPLNPQVVTEVTADDLTDLSDLVGPELATLVTPPSDICILNMGTTALRDSGDSEVGGVGHNQVDLDRFLGGDQHHQDLQSSFSYKRVYFARKGSITNMSEKNNNTSNISTTLFNNGQAGGEEVTTSDSITKAFLLQYRDNIQNEMNLAFLRNAEAKKGDVSKVTQGVARRTNIHTDKLPKRDVRVYAPLVKQEPEEDINHPPLPDSSSDTTAKLNLKNEKQIKEEPWDEEV